MSPARDDLGGELADDVHLQRGETWAVVTSNVEGTSYLTVYAPEIYNWDCHKRFAKISPTAHREAETAKAHRG